MKRFLSSNKENNCFIIENTEHNHLKNVLRQMPGDEIEVVGFDEFVYVCKIKEIAKNFTIAEILEKKLCFANPKKDLTVFQALVKNDNMSLIVQKLSEIGVSTLIPFESEFITAKDSKNKQGKLQEIANQSIKQCKRSIPMMVENTISFKDLLKIFENFDVVLFANEQETISPVKDVLNNLTEREKKKIALIVGSEGGFSVREVDELKKLNNVKSFTLGKRILRAETASIMLSGIVLYELEEFC